MANDDRRLVYSTDGTLPLPSFDAPRSSKKPHASTGPALPLDGIVRVGCERRRGGSVTLVYGLAANEVQSLGAELRKRCGTGGTVKDGVVSLQGDKRDDVLAYLAERGRRAKRMGG